MQRAMRETFGRVVDSVTGETIETRYKPWGEVRYTDLNKTLPTRYTFTGQYSYIADDATDIGAAGFGLMFYNARWYDSALGRFAQADTIVPGGVQGLDRYAYVANNPLRYIDPTGHRNCEEDGYNCPDNDSGLFLTGSQEDIQRLLNIINRLLHGYTATVDSQGHVTITQTGDTSSPTDQEIVFFNELSKSVNSDTPVIINVVSGDPHVFGDDFPSSTVDVEDLEKLGYGSGLSAGGNLTHMLAEQYAKQVLGITDFRTAHYNYGIPAEEAFTGATRTDEVTGDTVVITYDYGNGILFYVYVDPRANYFYKWGCDPLTLTCYGYDNAPNQ